MELMRIGGGFPCLDCTRCVKSCALGCSAIEVAQSICSLRQPVFRHRQSLVIVDNVVYTAEAPWPRPTGCSMMLLDPNLDNQAASSWSEALTWGGRFDTGSDLGMPEGGGLWFIPLFNLGV